MKESEFIEKVRGILNLKVLTEEDIQAKVKAHKGNGNAIFLGKVLCYEYEFRKLLEEYRDVSKSPPKFPTYRCKLGFINI